MVEPLTPPLRRCSKPDNLTYAQVREVTVTDLLATAPFKISYNDKNIITGFTRQ